MNISEIICKQCGQVDPMGGIFHIYNDEILVNILCWRCWTKFQQSQRIGKTADGKWY